MEEYLIPLKLKYRRPGRRLKRDGIDPPEGTWTYNAGTYKSKSSNTGAHKVNKQGTGARRRQGFGAVKV